MMSSQNISLDAGNVYPFTNPNKMAGKGQAPDDGCAYHDNEQQS